MIFCSFLTASYIDDGYAVHDNVDADVLLEGIMQIVSGIVADIVTHVCNDNVVEADAVAKAMPQTKLQIQAVNVVALFASDASEFWLARVDKVLGAGQSTAVQITWLEIDPDHHGRYELGESEPKPAKLGVILTVVRAKLNSRALQLRPTERDRIIALTKDVVSAATAKKIAEAEVAHGARAQAVKDIGKWLTSSAPEHATLHYHICPNGSNLHQLCDTHINNRYKSGMRQLYSDYQTACIQQQLAKYDGDLEEVEKLIQEGGDPRKLATWIPPADLAMQQPTRGMAILWGRRARAQFETENGRASIAKGYCDNGLARGSAAVPGSEPGEYLLLTTKQVATFTKEEERAKKKKARVKERADVDRLGWNIGFQELIARAGVAIDGDTKLQI
eukprot:SAG11_NODE_763_length_7292_cov_7.988322_2_plen_390_part_00